MNPRSEALAFRIWAHCKPIGWDCTMADLAERLDEPVERIRAVVGRKGWTGRLRSSRVDYDAHRAARGIPAANIAFSAAGSAVLQ